MRIRFSVFRILEKMLFYRNYFKTKISVWSQVRASAFFLLTSYSAKIQLGFPLKFFMGMLS